MHRFLRDKYFNLETDRSEALANFLYRNGLDNHLHPKLVDYCPPQADLIWTPCTR